MPISEQDMNRAIINLNAKTGLQWKLVSSPSNPNPFIQYNGVVPGTAHQSFQNAIDSFNAQMQDAGIKFRPAVNATTRGGTARISAIFSHPLEIMAMANNEFSPPAPMSVEEKQQVADILSMQTGFKWAVCENGVECHARIPGEDYMSGESDFKNLMKEKGIEFEPSVTGTMRGSHLHGGGVGIWAVFDHPLELRALLKSTPIQQTSPYILKDRMGDNVVTNVFKFKDERGSGYKIEGANCNGQPRSIIIFDTGRVVNGFDGSTNLGIVGTQMNQQRDAILEHFKVTKPKVTSGGLSRQSLLAAKNNEPVTAAEDNKNYTKG